MSYASISGYIILAEEGRVSKKDRLCNEARAISFLSFSHFNQSGSLNRFGTFHNKSTLTSDTNEIECDFLHKKQVDMACLEKGIYMHVSEAALPLSNPLAKEVQKQSEAGKEEGKSSVRSISPLPPNDSALGKRKGLASNCAGNLPQDGRKIQEADISVVSKKSETFDINERRESACFKKTDSYRGKRIRDLIENGRYSYRTPEDRAFIEELVSERLRLFPGKKSLKGNGGKYLESVKNSITEPDLLDIPLEILSPLNQEQLKYLHWMADNGFGIDLDYAENVPECVPETLLIRLLENRYISEKTKINSKVLSWLFTHENPTIVEYALKILPEKINRLAVDKIHKINWLSDELLHNTIERLIKHNSKHSQELGQTFEEKTSLSIGSLKYYILVLLTLCDSLARKNAALFCTLSLQEDKDIFYWAACFLGFKDVASVMEKPESKPCVELLTVLAEYAASFNKKLDEAKQKSFCENYLSGSPADRTLICEKWITGIFWKNRYSGDLSSRVSLSLLPSLLKNTNKIKIENLEFDDPKSLSRTEVSVLSHLYLNNKLELCDLPGNHFLSVVAPIAEGFDITSQQGFVQCMDRLISWDPLSDQSAKDSINNLSDGLKSLRPELLRFIKNHDTISTGDNEYNIGFMRDIDLRTLPTLLRGTEFFKYQIVASFLEHGRQENIQALLKHWLEAPTDAPAKQWLFQQFLHPNNAFFHEHINCNVLLNTALNLLPAPPENTMFDASISQPEVPDDEVLALMSRQPDSRINRTLIFKKDDKTEYLKIQTSKESRDAFCTQYQRLKYLSDYTSTLELKSHCGKPEGLYTTTLETLNLSDSDCLELSKIVGFDQRLIMRFSLPKDKPYEVYVNSPDITSEAAYQGLVDHAHDYGTLWNLGFNGPDALSAYHDEKSGRRFHFLAEVAHIINLGVIDQWRLNARYPNIGVVGMRDHGDTWPCGEFGSDHLSANTEKGDYMAVNPNDPKDINRVRLLALAQTAWGMVLLWGDRYNNAMEKATTAEQMEQAKADNDFKPAILPMLSTLFSRAFNMEQGECERIMQEDGLYDQAVREMGYWMDNVNAPYVDDMKAHRINREIYPYYPQNLRAPTFSEKKLHYLTPNGFISESAKNLPGRQSLYSHLGCVPNGRNPLLSLNALVVKMITLGCLNLSRES